MKPSKQKVTPSKNEEKPSSDISIQNQALEKIARGLKTKSQKKDSDTPKKGKN